MADRMVEGRPFPPVPTHRSELRDLGSARAAYDRRQSDADRGRQLAGRGAHGRVFSGRPLVCVSDLRVWEAGDCPARIPRIERRRARLDRWGHGPAMARRRERDLLRRA